MRALIQLLAAFAVIGVPDVAAAQTIAEKLTGWGLTGTWSIVCAREPNQDQGAKLTYRAHSNGTVTHDRDFGNRRRDSSRVLSANISGDGLLTVVVDFKSLKQKRKFTFKRHQDGRIRAISNATANGDDVTIKNGKFIFNGKTTPWQTRCH